MDTLDGLLILDHYTSLLEKGKEKNAWSILHEFFDFLGGQSPKEHLWYMLVLALKSDNEEIEARHRSNMIFFYEYSVALFKAAHTLYIHQKKPAHRIRNNKQRKKKHK
jgi:hypothetical protein